jgi:hypothetical protein
MHCRFIAYGPRILRGGGHIGIRHHGRMWSFGMPLNHIQILPCGQFPGLPEAVICTNDGEN